MILTKVKNEIGATAIEYGILSALIGVATITAMQLTGVKLDNTYCYIATQISKAVGGSGGRCSGSSASQSISSSPKPIIYNASKDYSDDALNAWADLQLEMMEFKQIGHGGFKSMSGIYDAEGNAIKTPEDIKNYFGFSDQAYELAMGKLQDPNGDYQNASYLEMDNLSKSGKRYYIPNPKNVTITATDGTTYKFNKESTGPNVSPGKIYELYRGPGGNDYDSFAWYHPTNQ